MSAQVAAPVRVLWGQLEGLEHWGVLEGRAYRGVRDVLRVLCHAQHSRAVVITARQLATRVGLSTRWTRRCLHVLEALGLVRWTRGHIEEGRPRPGWITVRAGRLAQVVTHAREAARAARAEHRKRTDARIRSTVRQATLWPRKTTRNPLSDQAELSASLPLWRGKGAEAPPSASPPGRRHPAERGDHGMHICAAHDIPIDQCAICRRTLERSPGLDVKTLYKTVPTEERTDQREVTRQGLAQARAAMRQQRHTQEPLL